MTAGTTIFLSWMILAILTLLACADSIRIYRHVQRQRLLSHEKWAVIFFSLLLPGFNIFGYAHFHEKDRRESLQEFKKFSLYRDFTICHSWFFALAICCNPPWLWDVVDDPILGILVYIAFIPFSMLFSLYSFAIQMPNFFDRYSLIKDEFNRQGA